MAIIRFGLEDNLDASIYAKECYNSKQMSVIHTGLKLGLPVENYLDPNLSWKKMDEIRNQLEFDLY